jgi:hypothetical protein
MIDGLHPRVKGSLDALEQLMDLSGRMLVGLAFRIVRLRHAGVRRPELHTSSATAKAITFHDFACDGDHVRLKVVHLATARILTRATAQSG